MKPLLIHLHLYYTDLFNWFIPYLKNVNVKYDLYITLTQGHCPENFDEKILLVFPEAKIRYLPNKGMDVYPFLWVLKEIENYGLKYSAILKLHGKKSLIHKGFYGETWRKTLVDALLLNASQFDKYLEYVSSTKYKMIGAKHWVLKETAKEWMDKFFPDGRIPKNYAYEFIGGTMFLVDFNLFMKWFKDNEIFFLYQNDFKEGYVSDHSIAHHLERAFGLVVCITGNEILKV